MRILRGGSSVNAPGRGGRRRRAIIVATVRIGGEGYRGSICMPVGSKMDSGGYDGVREVKGGACCEARFVTFSWGGVEFCRHVVRLAI